MSGKVNQMRICTSADARYDIKGICLYVCTTYVAHEKKQQQQLCLFAAAACTVNNNTPWHQTEKINGLLKLCSSSYVCMHFKFTLLLAS